MTFVLVAPGPSANRADIALCAGLPIGAIGCTFELIDKPIFLASSDRGWWRKYPEAIKLDCPKYAMAEVSGVERVQIPQLGAVCNSGVLALEIAVRLGANRIILLGFDMSGSHYFGEYTNGLRNTTPAQRQQHFRQYDQWARANRSIKVINCSRSTSLTTFPRASLESILEACVPEFAPHQA